MYHDNKILDYIENWRHTEEWTNLNVALDHGDLLYSCELMASTGVITASTPVERAILRVAKLFRKMDDHEQQKYVEKLYSECFISSCNDCNSVQFLDCGNEEIYPEVKTECWCCKSKNIETGRGVK